MKNKRNLLTPPAGLGAFFAKVLTVRTRDGVMKGAKWSLKAGGKIFRVMQGTYEVDQTKAFVNEVKPGDCLLDVGAHVGWYSILSSRLVGPKGKVLAVEANPRNYWYLRRHVQINQDTDNIEAIHLGVADKQGVLSFEAGTGTGTGHLATGEAEASVKVETDSLDQIIQQKQLTPTHIKIDVEGAEVMVLKGAEQLLKNHKPLLFLSTHGETIRQDCMTFLSDLGYQFETMSGQALSKEKDFICRHAG